MEQDTTTWFAYNVSWIVSEYLHACILALAAEGDPGACTLVSFQYLIYELGHGWYTRCTLPRSLQNILTIRAGRRAELAASAAQPPPAPQTIDVEGRAGGGRGGGGGRGVIVPSRAAPE